MTAVAPQITHERASLGADAREIVGTVLVGTAAGAVAGIVVGGIGGRLVMLVLRVLSDPIVIGTTSDDGFEIGRFTVGGTLQLVGGMAALGAANGVAYAVLRDALPRRARASLWSLFGAAVGGTLFVHSGGVDFTLLDPLWLAVAAFVVLPGLAALLVVLLVERWLRDGSRPRPALLVIAALAGTVGLAFTAVAAVVVLAARRLGLSGRLARAGRLILPGVLVIGIVAGAWHTAVEATKILG